MNKMTKLIGVVIVAGVVAACSSLKGSGVFQDAGDDDGGSMAGGQGAEDGGATQPLDSGVPGGPETCEAPGVRRCDATSIKVEECDGEGRWTPVEECANVCAGSVCAGVCRPGRDFRCGSDNKSREACTTGGAAFAAEQTCSQACKEGRCLDCKPGDRRCTEKQPEVCDAGGVWVADGPACANGCDPANGLCQDCATEGEKKCVGKAVTVCSGGKWSTQMTCSETQGCIAGACTACDPANNQQKCSGDVQQTCGSNGTWVTAKDCAAQATSCAGGSCGECKIDSKTCNGKVPVTCNAQARWATGAACDVYCNPADGTCKECAPDDKRCSPSRDAIQTCTGGTWANQTSCSTGCTPGASTCNVCTPGSKRCVTSGSPHRIETCKADGSGWMASGECGAYACSGGACKTSCTAGADCVGVDCIATKCGVKLGPGEGCTGDSQCGTGYCTDGVCCNARCDQACKSCGTGTCSDVTGEDPGMCSGTKTCSAGCKLKDKQPCATDADCASGACRTYYLDQDGDTYGRNMPEKFCGTVAPSASYILRGGDCCDSDAEARPGIDFKLFRRSTSCGTGDFNCNGVVTKYVVDPGKTDQDLREFVLITRAACQATSNTGGCNSAMVGFLENEATEASCGKQIPEYVCSGPPFSCGLFSRWGQPENNPTLLCF